VNVIFVQAAVFGKFGAAREDDAGVDLENDQGCGLAIADRYFLGDVNRRLGVLGANDDQGES